MPSPLSRRLFVSGAFAAAITVTQASAALAQSAQMPFPRWIEAFRARVRARGVSDATYDRVMANLKPDTAVFALERDQPEFHEELWQYLNRRVSDWRVRTGKERAREYHDLLAGVERDYGVDPYVMLGLWGMESAFGDVVVNRNHMRPVIPALATLAWGDPRRRSYWEQELANALVIVGRGWANPDEMIGSWAGAMGHTQWMPEVWLHMGVDYDHDGRISPYGKPDDALAGTARYLAARGHYRRGEAWGYEVRLGALSTAAASRMGMRTIAQWQSAGVVPADGSSFPRPAERAKAWVPV